MGDRLKLGLKMVSIPTVAFSDDGEGESLFASGKTMYDRHDYGGMYVGTMFDKDNQELRLYNIARLLEIIGGRKRKGLHMPGLKDQIDQILDDYQRGRDSASDCVMPLDDYAIVWIEANAQSWRAEWLRNQEEAANWAEIAVMGY